MDESRVQVFKLVFYVLPIDSHDVSADHASEITPGRQQITFDIPMAALRAETRTEAAQRVAAMATMCVVTPEALRELRVTTEATETLEATAMTLARYLDLKLREWARSQPVPSDG